MAANPMAAYGRSVTRRLTGRYVLALGAIALLSLIGQVVVQVALAQQTDDARVINVAALQRTLGERMSKAALAILVTADPAAQAPYIAELRGVVAQWERSHLALQHGDASLGLPGHNSPTVTRLFARIAPSFNVMLDAATDLLVVIDTQPPVPLPSSPSLASAITPYVEKILGAEPAFLTGMDSIVSQYQHEAEARVAGLRSIEVVLLGSVVTVVVLLGVLVFRPATRQVGRSIADLIRAQEREHELAALKDQFIIDANHELRTPIMALYNNLEILAALEQRGAAPEQRARILQRALRSGDAVLRLLTSVLDTGALEGRAPRLTLKPVPLAPLVRAVLETFDPREVGDPEMRPGDYEARAVTVNVAPDLTAWADEDRVRQVLVNLLANALKYSPPGAPISVAAGQLAPATSGRRGRGRGAGEAPRGTTIQVSVRDRGLGVPPRDIPKLFNRFVRLERDIAGPVRGTGVGLYLCRVLVEAMGGQIWVDSNGVPGEGSTFSFTLPGAVPVAGQGAGGARLSPVPPAYLAR
jgi:signal transduction histidine kinase